MRNTARFPVLLALITILYIFSVRIPGDSSVMAQLVELDFGDAEYLGSWGGYPTLLAQDGARHIIGGPWLGDSTDFPDAEPDGQPHVTALGDDTDGSDDENGVSIETLYPAYFSEIHLEVSGGGGIVEAWIDYNDNHQWEHPGEQVYAGYLADGTHTIQVAVVTNATIGQTIARFRISTAGGLSPTGEAADGEVEDHEVWIEAPTWDFGDAPDGVGAVLYPTLLSNNGARHLARGPWLGDSRDAPDIEADGQPQANGLGDDNDGGDDENGVNIPSLLPGNPANLTFIVSGGGGYVDGWIDYNSDKTWQDPDEKVISGYYADGVHSLAITVPGDAEPGQTFGRFRISETGDLPPTGAAYHGEVEDYEVAISYKWEQMPDLDTTGIAWTIGEYYMGFDNAADDFECRQPGYIREVQFWVAFKDDEGSPGGIGGFEMKIFSNLPDSLSPTGYAIQDSILWQGLFPPAYYSFSVWDPDISGGWHEGDHLYFPAYTTCYLVTVTIPAEESFFQTGTPENPQIYWLEIVCSMKIGVYDNEIGWMASTEHWNACAIDPSGDNSTQILYPPGHIWAGENIDLAFRLTSEPGLELDWGDAPDDFEPVAYPTLYAHNGARHVIGGPWLGDAADAPDGEVDGQPNPGALGDDNHADDDENGVQIPALVTGEDAEITIEVSGGGGFVQGWIDFDRDEIWNSSTEMVVAQSLADGVHVLAVPVSATLLPGPSFARFRISSTGDLEPTGRAEDGEVEDYEVVIQDPSTDAEERPAPARFKLYQSVPNPFNPVTSISFDLPDPQQVMIVVFAVDGRRITTLIDSRMTAGRHSVVWDGRNDSGRPVASGVYFYRIKAGPNVETRRMVLLR